MPAKALIIADDLTGAADTGLQFRNHDFSVRLSLTDGFLEGGTGSDVQVISTESRNLSWSDAQTALRPMAASLSRMPHPAPLLYKKIDSTLRGWIGAEIKVMLDALPSSVAWIVPAYPKQGRRMEQGIYTVHGRPLHETEFISDVVGGIVDSLIPPLLERQIGERVCFIGTDTVLHGAKAIIATVHRARRESGVRAVLFDAATDEQIHSVVEAGRHTDTPILWVGSAGLAGAIARQLQPSSRIPETLPTLEPGPVVISAGSQNPATHRQVAFLKERVSVRHWILPDIPTLEMDSRQHHLLTLPEASLADVRHEMRLAEASVLGKVTAEVIRGTSSKRIFLTGGDTAAATFRHLDVSFLEIIGTVEEAMPLLQVSGGPADGALAVTKAGGFGGEASLYNAFRALTGGINDA